MEIYLPTEFHNFEAEARVSLVLQSENKFANWLKPECGSCFCFLAEQNAGGPRLAAKCEEFDLEEAAAAGILKALRHITSIVLMAIQVPARIKVCGRANFLHHKHHFKRNFPLTLVRKKWLCAIILRARSIQAALSII